MIPSKQPFIENPLIKVFIYIEIDLLLRHGNAELYDQLLTEHMISVPMMNFYN